MQAAVVRVPNGMKGLSTTLQSLLIVVGRWIPLLYTLILDCTKDSHCKLFFLMTSKNEQHKPKVSEVGFVNEDDLVLPKWEKLQD